MEHFLLTDNDDDDQQSINQSVFSRTGYMIC